VSRTDPQPLDGLVFLNLRAAEDAAALTRALEALGATVVERPVIAFVPPLTWAAFDARLARLAPGDWIAFTSATAVRCTLRRLGEQGRGPAALAAARIAAIGLGTARALADAGLPVKVTPPEQFQAEGLRDALLQTLLPGEEVWLPRAEQGREALAQDLERAGHAVRVTPVYRTVAAEGGLGPAAELLERGGIDWIVFTSSSTVTHFLALLPPRGKNWLERPKIACLGRVTARTAEAQGLTVAVVPARQDLAGLVDAVVAAVSPEAARAIVREAGKP
jgi:uroporphyrinogen-III synthase